LPNWKKVIVSGSNAALNSLNVSTSFTASGLIYPTADNGEESFIQTDGNGTLSLQYVKTIYEEIYNGEATTLVKGTPVYVSGSVGAAAQVFRADAGNPAKMPVIYISADTIASGGTGRGIALGLIKGVDTTGYPAGTEIYVGVGGGWTSTRPTGSAIVQTLGYVTKEGAGGQGVVLNPGPNSLPNLPSGSVWVGNSSSIPTPVFTSSLSVASASFASTSSFTTAVSGTTNYVSKFTGTNTLGDSQIFDTGTQVKIGNFNLAVASTTLNLAITGSTRFSAERNAFIEIFTNASNSPRINGYGNGVNITTSNSYGISNGNINLQPQQNSNITNTVTGTGVQTWSTGGSERMRITDTGNVGIGTTTPNSRLDVNGNTTITGSLAVSQSLLQYSNITSVTSGSTSNVASFSTGSYTAAFFDYVTTSGTNARAGTVFTVWNANNVEFTETSTNDIGNTSNLVLSASLSAGAIRLQATSLSGSWSVKTLARML